MQPREHKERKERKERKKRQEKIRHAKLESQTKTKGLVSRCRSGFYAGALGSVRGVLNESFPRDLAALIYGYYLNLNHCHVKELQQLAALGNQSNPIAVDAMARLGFVHHCHGGFLEITQSRARGTKWLRLARERPDLPAGQWALGFCHYGGIDVERNAEAAVAYFSKAANQGYAPAQSNLGVCYCDGDGVVVDFEKATGLYRLAAEQGYARAQWHLATCYYRGEGVPQDYKEAARLYRLAVAMGEVIAHSGLGVCYEEGRGVPQDYKEAVRLYRLAAERGLSLAQFHLGVCYELGQGVAQDRTRALHLYKLAADQYHSRAREALERLRELKWLKESKIDMRP